MFFPVVFLYGVSKFLFSALALAVVFSLFASYVVALTVVPLFCAKLIKHRPLHAPDSPTRLDFRHRFNHWFNARFGQMLDRYDHLLAKSLARP